MKKFFIVLSVATVIGCNNTADADKKGGDTSLSSSEKPATPDPGKGRGCSTFFWFKEGSSFSYDVKDGEGKIIANTTTLIDKVHTDGGAVIADYTTTFADGKKVNASYRCEGDKLYMNMKSLMSSMKMEQAGVEMEVSDAYISFPWDMKPGDKLDDAVFEIKSKRNGKEFMTMKMTTSDRTVGAPEKITTPAGTWDCLVITEKMTSTATMMGKQMMTQEMKSVQYFAPEAGLVKFETRDASGKIQTQSELSMLKN
jgi:hypothetical protein